MAESIKNKYSNLSTLTDSVILSLYKAAGLQNRLRSSADYDWVRQKFGNNIGSLTTMLSQEKAKAAAAAPAQGQTNTSLPNNSSVFSNAIANYKEQPAAQAVKPYFVKFNADPNGTGEGDQSTVWYMDDINKVLRPILNWQAFSDLYDGDEKKIQDAVATIRTYSPTELMPGGKLNGFHVLGSDYAVNENKQIADLPFSPATVSNRYGRPVSADTLEKAASFMSESLIPLLIKSGISPDFANKIKNDHTLMGGYGVAYGYGGYTMEDLYKDVKAKELASSGDAKYNNVKFIDGSQTQSEYALTNDYKSNFNDPKLNSLYLDGTGLAQKNYDYISTHPDELYQALDPKYAQVKNDKVKAAMEDVQSVLHDKVLEVLDAKTDAEKQSAEQDWVNYKSDVERNLGWKLSDNALEAWNQLQALQSKFNQAGLTDTGVENSAIDEYLKNVRNTNDKERTLEQTDVTRKTEEHAKQYASPEEIQKMNDEDQAKGLPRDQWRSVLWGLAPAEKMTKEKYLADFRAKYSDEASKKLTDQEILDMYYSQQYDDNGNYRSSMYETKNNQEINIKYGQDINFSYMPAQSAADYKYGVALDKLNQEDIDAMKAYDSQNSDPNNPNFNKSYVSGPTGTTGSSASGTTGTTSTTGPTYSTLPSTSIPSGPQNYTSQLNSINPNIQTLINTNRVLNNNDADQMFMYYYGRPATAVEKSYWTKKTSKQLEAALKPNAGQFKNAGYYKDTQNVVVSSPATASSTPVKPATVTPPSPVTGTGLYKPTTPTATPTPVNIPKITTPQPAMSSIGTYKPSTVQTPTPIPAPATDDFASSIKSQAGLNWLKQRGLNK